MACWTCVTMKLFSGLHFEGPYYRYISKHREFWIKVSIFFQARYIAICIDEIKNELKQENIAIKANAVNKLFYVSNIEELYRRVGFTFLILSYLCLQYWRYEPTILYYQYLCFYNVIRNSLIFVTVIFKSCSGKPHRSNMICPNTSNR